MARSGAQAPEKKVAYTDEEIEQLAAYVASLGPGPAVPDDEVLDISQGDVGRGGELFRVNCSACHNTTGQGGALSYGKYAPSITGLEPRHLRGDDQAWSAVGLQRRHPLSGREAGHHGVPRLRG